MTENFYLDFEQKFYASKNHIRRLRAKYIPYLNLLTTKYHGCSALDIGCGRGEWLDIMTRVGFKPIGVDIDQGMMSEAQSDGFETYLANGVDFIKNLEDESQIVVSAFHVVEHIDFDELRTLVSEAHRVLMPGGLLIIETPNPQNIFVATNNFYLDPTHKRLIPHPLMEHLASTSGFERYVTNFINSSISAYKLQHSPSLNDAFFGISPDYSVIAQKNTSCVDVSIVNVGPVSKIHQFSEVLTKVSDDISLALEQSKIALEQSKMALEQSFVRSVKRFIKFRLKKLLLMLVFFVVKYDKYKIIARVVRKIFPNLTNRLASHFSASAFPHSQELYQFECVDNMPSDAVSIYNRLSNRSSRR